MLAKIFGILLGIVGVTTTTMDFPDRPPLLPKTQTAVVKVIAKIRAAAPKTEVKKPPAKGLDNKKTLKAAAAPKAAEAPRPATTTNLQTHPNDISVGRVSQPVRTAEVARSDGLSNFPTNPTPSPPVNFEVINQAARKAIVNIICTSKTGGSFNPLSASGVMIDPRGIILTNAHAAEYFLLKDYGQIDFLSCVGRAGSPAAPVYTLKLLYISTNWLKENYQKITDQKPTGTGEYDFALLQVASSTNPDVNLPTSFPALRVDGAEENIKTGQSVVLASYPAGFLGGIAIQRDLYIVSTIVNIGQRFTFKSNTVDAFSLGGSPVAQQGSSGGAVVGAAGKLLGIIVTSTDAKDTAGRDLDAISVSHINRTLFAETGFTLDSLLVSDIVKFSSQFQTEILPGLKKLLFEWLNSKNR